jgi:hypothetical protein
LQVEGVTKAEGNGSELTSRIKNNRYNRNSGWPQLDISRALGGRLQDMLAFYFFSVISL